MQQPVPFRLRVPGDSRVDDAGASSTTYRMHGHASLDGGTLQLQWSGTAEISEAGRARTGTRREPLPVAAVEIPAGRLREVALRGRWWRPRIEITTADLDQVAMPGATGGQLRLWLARRDRAAAAELVADLKLAMADAALSRAMLPSDSARARLRG